MKRRLIVNADDLGHTEGISRGIEHAHRNGIVTSTSFMVNRPATSSGVEVALRNPNLAVGLHFNMTDENPDDVDLSDLARVEKELHAQLAKFRALLGRGPTHLDCHHHLHWDSDLTALFKRVAGELGLPLRHYSRFTYVGGFYGQWEHGVTDLTHVQPAYFREMIEELPEGDFEVACHPGFVTPELVSIYSSEREEEVRTLTDPSLRTFLSGIGAELHSFATLK